MLRAFWLAAALALASAPALFAQVSDAATGPVECSTWQQCRDLAGEAAARGDYETFHDLAWRTVQKGPARNPELMFLLARAQSLSGRPDDALVMLRRITELGRPTVEALTSDEFRRVRALPGWSSLEALISAAASGATRPAAEAAPATDASAAGRGGAARRSAASPAPPAAPGRPAPPEDTPPGAPVTPPAPEAGAPVPSAAPRVEEALRFASPEPPPRDLAFDRVSDRFLFANGSHRKVTVVGEGSRRVVDLVRAESAGFYDIVALEIDTRRGDLWVISAGPARISDGDRPGGAALHKLQLISGRPLATIEAPVLEPPVRFADLGVTEAGAVIVLDAAGRVWRLPAGARALEKVADVRAPEAVSLALAGDRAYVAYPEGIACLDLATGRADPVRAAQGTDLAGFRKARWHDGTLVGVQDTPDGRRIVRAAVDRGGRRVQRLEVLEAGLPGAPAPPAVTVSGSDFYYVVSPGWNGGEAGAAPSSAGETVVRRLKLR